MKKLNILILGMLGNPKRRFKAVEELEFMLPLCAPEHNYILHDFEYPLPEFIKDIDFDAIIMNSTFLMARNEPHLYDIARSKYEFIRHSDAVKLAFPQDDYHGGGILDQWMLDWDIDHLFTICPSNWQLLYPKLIKHGVPIELAYTGYLSQSWIDAWQQPKSHVTRDIDVSYRADKVPPYCGLVGQDKFEIGHRFTAALGVGHNFKLDISTDRQDKIPGEQWHHFLENSKFCLVSSSGSSLLDPFGVYRQKIKQYIGEHPEYSFESVVANCYPENSEQNSFTMLSPRNLEAGLAKTVQIAIPGNYSELLQPYEHYIPLQQDCSNIEEVQEMMRDIQEVENIANRCKQLLLDTKALRMEHRCTEVITLIRHYNKERPEVRNFKQLKQQHWACALDADFKASLSFPELYQ